MKVGDVAKQLFEGPSRDRTEYLDQRRYSAGHALLIAIVVLELWGAGPHFAVHHMLF
jgi:hypothetical protein